MSMVRLILALIAILLSGLVTQRAAGQSLIPGYPPEVTAYDAREVGLLPHYCKYTQSFRDRVPGGNDQNRIQYYYATLGDPFHALHHYCWGLMKLNRATFLARDLKVRNFYLTDAIGEFDYVLDRSPDTFVLKPEILTKKGQSLVLLGKGARAVLEFERAMSIKPDYWPPYAHLSDWYRESGETEKARSTLLDGLELSPNVNALKQRLAELDRRPSKRNAR